MQIKSTLKKLMIAGACALLAPLSALPATTGELSMSSPEVQTAVAAQNSVTPDLMQRPGILGTAVGLNDDGTTNVMIFVDREAKDVADVVSSLPKQIGVVSVQVAVTDNFRAAIGQNRSPTRQRGRRTPRNKRRPFNWELPVAGAKTWPMVSAAAGRSDRWSRSAARNMC